MVPVDPVVLSEGAPVVPGPEVVGLVPVGLVVVGDALPLGLTSGLDAVLRDEVHAPARETNKASAERLAITDFMYASCGDFSSRPMRKRDAGEFLDTRAARPASCLNPSTGAALRTGEPRWRSD